jgi:hypothetical protein
MATYASGSDLSQIASDPFWRTGIWHMLCPSLRQEVPDCLASVQGQSIPNNQYLSKDVPQQMMQVTHHLRFSDRMVLNTEEGSSFRRHCINDRQVLPPDGSVHNRHLSCRCESAPNKGCRYKLLCLTDTAVRPSRLYVQALPRKPKCPALCLRKSDGLA